MLLLHIRFRLLQQMLLMLLLQLMLLLLLLLLCCCYALGKNCIEKEILEHFSVFYLN